MIGSWWAPAVKRAHMLYQGRSGINWHQIEMMVNFIIIFWKVVIGNISIHLERNPGEANMYFKQSYHCGRDVWPISHNKDKEIS
jgi:hypothetical protein